MKTLSYCECCGRKLEEIKTELSKIPFTNGKRKIGVHSQYEGHPDDIYANNTLLYCAGCGHKLKDSECYIEYNYPNAPNELLGYKCSNCNYEERF